MSERWHGTSGGYTNHACRCAPCTEAFRVTVARRRAERYAELAGNSDVQHGSVSTYTNWGCRCDECRTANAAYGRAYRARAL